MRCPRCGNSGIRLKLRRCVICGSAGCPRCSQEWTAVTISRRKSEFTCSQQCMYQWCLRRMPYYRSDVLQGISELMPMRPGAEPILNPVSPQAAAMLDVMLARRMEEQGRFAEAARIYDFYQMTDDHERVKAQLKGQLEFYLHALSTRRMNVSYMCRKCGYTIAIPAGTQITSLVRCLFCLEPIDWSDLLIFLRGALGGK